MNTLSAILNSLSESFKYIAGIYPISSICITDAVSLYGKPELSGYQVIQVSFLMGIDPLYYDRYYSTVFFFLKKMDNKWVCNHLLTYVKGFEPCYIDRFNACRLRVEAFYNAFINYMQGKIVTTKIISIDNNVYEGTNLRVLYESLNKYCMNIKISYK